MAKRRKLQVFVSSTYTDLIEERQAAVEAILLARHIPAGMELFAGGNEDQMTIIKRWIDESDVYMLLLGGKYGSIEKSSQKSYTELEFDYAKSIDKTVFVAVADDDYINQRVAAKGADAVMELKNREAYLKFKETVTGKYVKFWSNIDKLQLLIGHTIREIEQDESLVGWVPGSEASDTGAIAEELAKLVKENTDLRAQISNAKLSVGSNFNGLDFESAYNYLSSQFIDTSNYRDEYKAIFRYLESVLGVYPRHTALHFFWLWNKVARKSECDTEYFNKYNDAIEPLEELGLIDEVVATKYGSKSSVAMYVINESGFRFMLNLKGKFRDSTAQNLADNIKEFETSNYFDPIG